MSLRLRSLLAFLALVLVFSGFLYREIRDSLDTRYREAVEENMVDEVRMLSALLATGLSKEDLSAAMVDLADQRFQARIYSHLKTSTHTLVYVTDEHGKVLYHSQDTKEVGKDYSDWRDVALTLQGRYGARSTRVEEQDDRSSVLYVAAPIKVAGKIVGVVTLGKPVSDFLQFIENAKREFLQWLTWGLGLLALGAVLISLWWTSPIRRMSQQAQAMAVAEGGHGEAIPAADSTEPGELKELGAALRSMNASLQAKMYVESYVQSLTHELKSPISAILGAAEILEGPLEDADRARFLSNVKEETARMRALVNAILQVAALERRDAPERRELVSVGSLLESLRTSLRLHEQTMGVTIQWPELPDGNVEILCDPLLVVQALHNLLLNSLEHSVDGMSVELWLGIKEGRLQANVRDHGIGIPEFALNRLGEKFYTLPKPRSGRKGTGLGLALVRECARLHKGEFRIGNHPEGGTEAIFSF